MHAAARWIAGRRTAFSSTTQALLDHWLQGDMPLAPAVRRMPKRAVHAPLFPTIAQQRLWFLDQLEPGNPAYHVPVAYHVQGRLNVAALAQSINAIVHRHEMLRTTFPAELGCPMQVIAPSDTVHDTPRSLQDIVVPLYGARRHHRGCTSRRNLHTSPHSHRGGTGADLDGYPRSSAGRCL